MIAIYMPAAFGAAWQYCSYRHINLPLLKITFCFHTASAGSSHRCSLLESVIGLSGTASNPPESGRLVAAYIIKHLTTTSDPKQ
jgi:hypothetical protein